MWELPHAELCDGETHEAAAERLLGELRIVARLGAEVLTVRHGVTRFRITMVCLDAKYQDGQFASPFYADGRWVEPTKLSDYPVSSPQRRLAAALAAGPRQQRLF
jgi:A/G-specific adenine glycosylase